jgi:hypothetical protein
MSFRKSIDPKTASIELRVTPVEKEIIAGEASSRMLSVSAFALQRMLGKQAPERYDYHAILMLRRLAALLKVLHREAQGREDLRIRLVLDEIVVAINQLWKARAPL